MATIASRDPDEQPTTDACDHRGEVILHRATRAENNPDHAEWWCSRCRTWLGEAEADDAFLADFVASFGGPHVARAWEERFGADALAQQLRALGAAAEEPDTVREIKRSRHNTRCAELGIDGRICTTCGSDATRTWQDGGWLCDRHYEHEARALDMRNRATRAEERRRNAPIVAPPLPTPPPSWVTTRLSDADRMWLVELLTARPETDEADDPPKQRGGRPPKGLAARNRRIRELVADGVPRKDVPRRIRDEGYEDGDIGYESVKQIARGIKPKPSSDGQTGNR